MDQLLAQADGEVQEGGIVGKIHQEDNLDSSGRHLQWT